MKYLIILLLTFGLYSCGNSSKKTNLPVENNDTNSKPNDGDKKTPNNSSNGTANNTQSKQQKLNQDQIKKNVETPGDLEAVYYCTDGENGYDLQVDKAGKAVIQEKKNQTSANGTYTINNGKFNLIFPDFQFNETSIENEVGFGLLLRFKTTSLSCHIVGHNKTEAIEGYLECPTMRHIPDISYTKMAFQIYTTGMVKKRRWLNLVAANDTLYSESWGIYLVIDEEILMFFGDEDEDRVLTGKIQGDKGILIEQLEPELGACVPE